MLRIFLNSFKITCRKLDGLSNVSINIPVTTGYVNSNQYHLTSSAITGVNFFQLDLPSKQTVRNYAKNKDRKKEKGKTKIEVNETQLAEIINLDSFKKNMEKAVSVLKDDFTKHLSLRSTTGSIESLQINIDGKEHTLQELGQIVRKNPKTIVINMAVFPQAIPAAMTALAKSAMNLNPQQDGTTIYIPVPIVTKEHREQLAKNAKALFIKCKDSLRDVQVKQIKSLKKKEGISSDLIKNVELQIVAIADKHINEAEKITENKQNELIGKQ